jgi:hypothetical protein
MNVPSAAPRRVGFLCALALASPRPPLAVQEVIPGLDAAGMDRSVRPGDDFYRYANGVRAADRYLSPPDRDRLKQIRWIGPAGGGARWEALRPPRGAARLALVFWRGYNPPAVEPRSAATP